MDHAQHDFLDPAVLSRLANLPLFARKPMLGNVSGRHRSPHHGSSIEFAEYRKYVVGDDPRRLDWRAYGRSDRFYVKEFEADTNLRLVAVLDTSGSMGYRTQGDSKLVFAKRLLANLMYLASQQGDAVGLTTANVASGSRIPARRNAAHLRAIFEFLNTVESSGETNLIESLHAVAEQNGQRALVVVVSDFFVDPSDLADCFQHLRFRKHDVAAFHLLDNAELEFDFERPIRFFDLEGGNSLLVEPSAIRNEYAAALGQYLAGLDAAVRDAAVDYQRVGLHEDFGDVLARFLVARTPRLKGRSVGGSR